MNKLYENLLPKNGYVIGELACGHEGDFKKLKQLIEAVAVSGADGVKFQIFIPQERANKDHHEWDIFNKLAISEEDWKAAANYARQKKLAVFADIFGEASFQIAKRIGVDGFKIHSEDLLNTFFISRVAQENKILMIGVGGAHRIEIYQLLNYLKTQGLVENLLLTTGVQTFPTPLEVHFLQEVSDLLSCYSSFGVKLAFADHISGDLEEAKIVPLMALAKGAAVIEKHVTINRDDEWEDYQSALSKEVFGDFVKQLKKLSPLLKELGPQTPFEIQYRKIFKKTPVAAIDLESGQLIKPEHIKYVKHAKHAVPLSALNLVGRQCKNNLSKGQVLRLKDIKVKVGGIIVARCSSNRLPSKATRKILERETIALLIERIKRCRNLDCVVLATSTDPSDDVLEEIAKREGVLPFRGSLENLSLRFYQAAKHYNIDHIVRVTGDDIIRDEVMIDKIVESHLFNSSEVTFADNMPYGTVSDVFSLNAIETILNTAQVPENTEYLEWYLGNSRYFSINYVKSDYEFNPRWRLTLDYEEDFLFFKEIFECFYGHKPDFTLADVLKLLADQPQIAEINMAKTAKYTKNDINVKLTI
ncbi:MAG: N-acetylneuraminate synthase family protein [Candidatus Omnitrophica bacterium]|nr:N-acetylneuraminate synthase family protein [Candidatus Omnitrophota bacterium]